jgi:hypothetical protein
MSGLEPIIIGAAIGAGTSAIAGGDPLKGAVLGGATGGITGGGGVGGLFGGNPAAGGSFASGAATVPAAAQGAASQAGLLFNPATGSFLNPEYYALASSANPIYTGASSLGSQIATGARSLMDTPFVQGLKDYLPSGQSLANLGMSSMQSRPAMPAPAGGVSKGTAPNIAAVEDLIKKRRAQTAQPTGLMGNYFG